MELNPISNEMFKSTLLSGSMSDSTHSQIKATEISLNYLLDWGNNNMVLQSTCLSACVQNEEDIETNEWTEENMKEKNSCWGGFAVEDTCDDGHP